MSDLQQQNQQSQSNVETRGKSQAEKDRLALIQTHKDVYRSLTRSELMRDFAEDYSRNGIDIRKFQNLHIDLRVEASKYARSMLLIKIQSDTLKCLVKKELQLLRRELVKKDSDSKPVEKSKKEVWLKWFNSPSGAVQSSIVVMGIIVIFFK